MTNTLDEVPGARERPSGCPVVITQENNGTVFLLLPPRGVSPIVLFFALVLLGNLLITLYTGLVLVIFHKSVLFMAQVSPSGLPVSLTRWTWLLGLGLLAAEALGFGTLWAILRPLSAREVIQIGPQWLTVRHSEWGRTREWTSARGDVRGFRLRRDPQGLKAGTLTVEGRGEAVEVGEFLREADQEWLESAGNALLRGMP